MDVQLTKDGVVVLYHSSDLSAHTNGKGAVKSFTYRELQRLDAAYYFDPQGNEPYPQRGLGHKIPTLDSILKNSLILKLLLTSSRFQQRSWSMQLPKSLKITKLGIESYLIPHILSTLNTY